MRPVVREVLSDREEQVLAALVRAHVDLGAPVGSASLLERERLDVSPATVRKTLVSLEDKGFVHQPHTSAGRMPTNKAYRFYATHALGNEPVGGSRELGSLRYQIEARLQQVSADEIHGQLAEIIGGVSMQLGLVLAPRFEQVRIDHLELVRLAESRMLLVVSLETGPVRSLVIEVGTTADPREVAGVSVRLNERLAGLTVWEVRATVRERIRELGTGFEPALLRAVVEEIETMAAPSKDLLHVAGARNICVQPEFRDASDVADLFDLVEHREALAGLLSDRQGVVVTIGDENELHELHLCSLVTASYQVHGAIGVIGVMGPTRMPYDRVVALVNYAASRAPDLVA
jgi:heat-inducible transcriptional repressor